MYVATLLQLQLIIEIEILANEKHSNYVQKGVSYMGPSPCIHFTVQLPACFLCSLPQYQYYF